MRHKAFISLFLLICSSIFAQHTAHIQSLLNHPLLNNANVGLLFLDAKTGKEVYSLNAQKSLIPASVLKLSTTATAFEMLGGEFVYSTTIGHNGVINSEGKLDGDLIIKASGDPTFDSKFFLQNSNSIAEKIAAILKKNKIKTIEKNLVLDLAVFDDVYIASGWLWEDIANYYGSGIYAISWRDNSFDLYLQSKQIGTLVEVVKTEPEIDGLRFTSRCFSKNIQSDSCYIYYGEDANQRVLRGAIPANRAQFVVKGAMPNPPQLFAKNVIDVLKKSGIVCNGKILLSSDRISNFNALGVVNSPTLSEIAAITNKYSHNLFAEALFKTVSVSENSSASRNASAELTLKYWRSKGVKTDGVLLRDGSGLSPLNLLTANYVGGILQQIYQGKNKIMFKNSLAIAGETGTLSQFLSNSSLKGKVFAKSGSMNGVKCYAGYIEKVESDYIFVILINNFKSENASVTPLVEKLLLGF